MLRTSLLVAMLSAVSLKAADEKITTRIREGSGVALEQLLGEHRLRLQWIEAGDKGEFYGKAEAAMNNGVIHLKGEQKGPSGNFLSVDGDILELTPISFRMRGKIVTRVEYLNNGAPCERDGEFTFGVYGGRPYWRLQQLQSPCGSHVDYVDVMLRPRPKQPKPPATKKAAVRKR